MVSSSGYLPDSSTAYYIPGRCRPGAWAGGDCREEEAGNPLPSLQPHPDEHVQPQNGKNSE